MKQNNNNNNNIYKKTDVRSESPLATRFTAPYTGNTKWALKIQDITGYNRGRGRSALLPEDLGHGNPLIYKKRLEVKSRVEEERGEKVDSQEKSEVG